jgi:outer membrane protein, heavy metal efflux system
MLQPAVRWSLLALSCAVIAGCYRGSPSDDVRTVRNIAPAAKVPSLPREPEENLAIKPGSVVTMEDAVELGLFSNRDLRADLRRIGLARAERVERALLSNPTFEFEILPERDSEYELRLEYELTGLLFSASEARAFEPHVRSEQLRVAGRALGLALQIREAFVQCQLARLRIEVAEEAHIGFQAAVELSEELLRVGNTTPLEVGLNRVASEKAKVLVGRLKLGELEARQKLAALMGVPSGEVNVKTELSLPRREESTRDKKSLLVTAINKNVELLALEAKAEGLGRRLGVVKARGWVPSVAADFHALRTRAESGGESGNFRFGGGVSAEIPLFDRKQGQRIALESELSASLEEYYGLRMRLGTVVETVDARCETTRERERLFEQEILPAQKQVTEQMRLQYNAMQVSLYDLLRVRQEQLALRLEYYDARGARAIAELERAALLAGTTVVASADGATFEMGGVAPRGAH